MYRDLKAVVECSASSVEQDSLVEVTASSDTTNSKIFLVVASNPTKK
jgi:hypothetical protein